MSKVLVTGFKPYSLLTHAFGNPSEITAEALGKRYGDRALVKILQADETTCLTDIELLGKAPSISGVLMLGANMQTSDVVLELEGVEKEKGVLGALKSKTRSTGAKNLGKFAESLKVRTASAPPTFMVGPCLRSYAAALKWAEPRGIPCIFLHLSTVRFSSANHIDTAAKFFERLMNG